MAALHDVLNEKQVKKETIICGSINVHKYKIEKQ